jgi:hypothetical protein
VGPREESSQQVAERWLAFARRLMPLEPKLLGRWGWAEESVENFHQLSLDIDTLREHVEEAGTQRRETHPTSGSTSTSGLRSAWWNGYLDDGEDVEFWVTAGLYTQVPGLMNVVHLDLSVDSADDQRRWLGLAEDALVALVEEWEPDCGYVGTHLMLDAQEQNRGKRDPCVGDVTYLSSGRRALLGSGLPGRVREARDGGLVISLLEGDAALPDTEQVVALAEQLRALGALAPTPTTRPPPMIMGRLYPTRRPVAGP